VPKEYVGWHVWVRIFYNLVKVCVGAENGSSQPILVPPEMGRFSFDHYGEIWL